MFRLRKVRWAVCAALALCLAGGVVSAAEKLKDEEEKESEYTSIRNINKTADIQELNRMEGGAGGLQLPGLSLEKIRQERRSVEAEIQDTIRMVRSGGRLRPRPAAAKRIALEKDLFQEDVDFGDAGTIVLQIEESDVYAQDSLSHFKTRKTSRLDQEYKYGKALMSPAQSDPVVSFEIQWADENVSIGGDSLSPYARVITETRVSAVRGAYTTRRVQKPVSVTEYRDGSVWVRYDDGTSLLVRKNRVSKKNPRRLQIATEESVKADGRVFFFKRYTDNTQEVLREAQESSPVPKDPEKPKEEE